MVREPEGAGQAALPPALANAVAADWYRRLRAEAGGDANTHLLACMLASWQSGLGAMPDRLGLTEDGFGAMLLARFPGLDASCFVHRGTASDPDRRDEHQELERLMLGACAGRSDAEVWMASIVATGCMAADHLWQDLGLWTRDDLWTLMRQNFPSLAARNHQDMKWKRFLYKQLCEAEGVYTCRAPSCAECVDYAECFGHAD